MTTKPLPDTLPESLLIERLEEIAKQEGFWVEYVPPDATFSHWNATLHRINSDAVLWNSEAGWAATKRDALESALKYWRFRGWRRSHDS